MRASTDNPIWALLSLLLIPHAQAQTCDTFGIDFQDGNSYFQNSLSSDFFTFVSEFEGCEDGIAQNVLIPPAGFPEYLCTNTTLRPDDTAQLSSCPIRKSDLTSGLWTLEVISNNGADGDPIAKKRDISLSVGPQATTTIYPTVTLPITVTPIINVTSTSTSTSTTVLPPATTTKPSTTLHPTTTITPSPVTTTKTLTLLTVTVTKPTLSVQKSTSTITATCITPKKAETPDPDAVISPTAIEAAAFATLVAEARFKRSPENRAEIPRERSLQEREAHFLGKRAPDAPVITTTETNTARFQTTTSTSTAPARTVTVIATITAPTVATSTPPPVTVFSGISTSALVTVTAPTVTKTKTKLVPFAFVTRSVTVTQTVTITTTTTPTGVAASCTSVGGKLS